MPQLIKSKPEGKAQEHKDDLASWAELMAQLRAQVRTLQQQVAQQGREGQ